MYGLLDLEALDNIRFRIKLAEKFGLASSGTC